MLCKHVKNGGCGGSDSFLCLPGNFAHPVVPFLVAGFDASNTPSHLSRKLSCISDRNMVHWFLSRNAFFIAPSEGYLSVKMTHGNVTLLQNWNLTNFILRVHAVMHIHFMVVLFPTCMKYCSSTIYSLSGGTVQSSLSMHTLHDVIPYCIEYSALVLNSA